MHLFHRIPDLVAQPIHPDNEPLAGLGRDRKDGDIGHAQGLMLREARMRIILRRCGSPKALQALAISLTIMHGVLGIAAFESLKNVFVNNHSGIT
mgnify:CR=1 FL=1